MDINTLLVRQGRFLFRWRSLIPLLLIVPALVALSQSTMIQQSYGDRVEDDIVFGAYMLSMLGLAVRWATVGYAAPGTSGRNTRGQRADSLNTTGLYSIVKNPLYLGNFLALLGMLAAIKVWWFVIIGALCYWIYIERVIAIEEEYLGEKFGDAYRIWAARTPIFIPDPRLWQKPDRPFSLRQVLRREYYGVAVVGAFFFVTDFILDIVIEGDPWAGWVQDDWFWIAEFTGSMVLFLILRFVKKRQGA